MITSKASASGEVLKCTCSMGPKTQNYIGVTYGWNLVTLTEINFMLFLQSGINSLQCISVLHSLTTCDWSLVGHKTFTICIIAVDVHVVFPILSLCHIWMENHLQSAPPPHTHTHAKKIKTKKLK